MNEHYAKAIDILMGSPVDFKAICIELAKQQPELFCTLAHGAAPSNDNAWHLEAIAHMRAGNLVTAIKLCRQQTGFGLKEAKDIIDALRNRDSDHWYSPADMRDEQREVYCQLVGSL